MSSAIFWKYIRESFLLWWALAIALFAFSWFRVWVISEISTARFQQILDLLPKNWRQFSPVDFDWLISYLGRTAMTLDEPMIALLIGAWALARGSDVVSGELSRGTLELVLSQPLSRRALFLQHAVWTLAGLAGLVLLVWLGMAMAVWTTQIEETTFPSFQIPFTTWQIPITAWEPKTELIPMRDLIHPIDFWPGIWNLFCFGCFLCCLTMLLSSVDRFRWRTIGIGIGIYFCQALIKFASLSTTKLAWLKWFTYFTLFEPTQAIEYHNQNTSSTWRLLRYDDTGLITGLSPWSMNLMLWIFAVVCLLQGLSIFHKRDLPAPL